MIKNPALTGRRTPPSRGIWTSQHFGLGGSPHSHNITHCPAQRRPHLLIDGRRLCIKNTAYSDMPAVQDRVHRARRASNLYPVHMDITNSYLRCHSDWSETAETSYLRLLTEVPPAVTGLTGKRVNRVSGGCKIAFVLLIEARGDPRYSRRHQWKLGSSD
jgi:hypothetical protein